VGRDLRVALHFSCVGDREVDMVRGSAVWCGAVRCGAELCEIGRCEMFEEGVEKMSGEEKRD
jgi:hypothetical protein